MAFSLFSLNFAAFTGDSITWIDPLETVAGDGGTVWLLMLVSIAVARVYGADNQ